METLANESGRNPSSHIKHSKVSPYATYSPWLSDKDFQAIYQRITVYLNLRDRDKKYL